MFTQPENKLYVKMADTPHKQAQGLMFVENMPENEGMLFIFKNSQNLSFWGENTYLCLDIAFVDDLGVIRKISNISPFSKKSVSSEVDCKYAIEANEGYFKKNKIQVGHNILIKNSHKGYFIVFDKISKQSKTAQSFIDPAMQRPIRENSPSEIPYNNVLNNNKTDEMNELDTDPSDQQNLPTLTVSDIQDILEDEIQDDQQDIIQEQEDQFSEDNQNIEDDQDTDQQNTDSQDIPPEEDLRNQTFNSIGEAFTAAQDNHQLMEIQYITTRKSSGHGGVNIGKRVIEPHGTYTSSPENDTSHQIAVTFDKTVGSIRAFRISNITTYNFLGKKFQPKFKFAGN